MAKKVIAVFTGNRAEYGLQYPILKAIDAHPELEYRLIVSGAHLDNNFGKTLKEIEADGFEIHSEVKIDMDEDTLYATAQAIGTGVLSMSQTLAEIKPDMLVVYADRFEGFAAVIASSQMNVPTAHIEGGDITEGGALDDSVRHAMTKLSHLHFTTNQQASNRLLAMGEEPWRVHTVGFPAIDLIQDGNYANAEELATQYDLDMGKPIVIFTQHSVTTQFEQASDQIIPSLDALKSLAAEGVQIVLTYPNNDAGGRKIIEELERFVTDVDKDIAKKIQLHRSLGRYNYHGFLALAKNSDCNVACVGNSSSGIKETPVFACPTLNIGSRQAGRLRGDNVIDVNYDTEVIYKELKRALFDSEFRTTCQQGENPYGLGDAGIKIANVLANTELGWDLLRKGMTLKGVSEGGWYQ